MQTLRNLCNTNWFFSVPLHWLSHPLFVFRYFNNDDHIYKCYPKKRLMIPVYKDYHYLITIRNL